MEEEIQFIIDSTKEQMQSAITHLDKAFIQIRAGKASPAMLASVKVDYYGSLTPLTQVANVSTPDAMTLSVQPWEKNLIVEIEKAIINSNLGFAPSNNGDAIIISIPPMTEERRIQLAKMAKSETENAKVSIRSVRKEANQDLKKIDGLGEDLVKDKEQEIQDLTNNFIKKTEDSLAVKEKEIMTV